MLNPVNSLASFVQAIGKAYIYVASDPTSAASWALLGLTEGDVGVDEKFNFNDYKLPEWTGDAVHARMIDGQDLVVNVPLIWGDAELYNTIAPSGTKGGGRSKPIAVATKTVFVIPVTEVGAGIANATGLTSGWTGGAGAPPVHSLLIHKATFEPGQYAYKHADGGKILRSIGIRAMYQDSMPEGQKLYTIGDPFAQGITTYRF